MRRSLLVLLVLVLLTGTACTAVPGPAAEFDPEGAGDRLPTPAEIAQSVIQPDDVQRAIGFLASDELRGRGTPSGGLERAAAFAAERFQLAGLEPAGGAGYLQYWPVSDSVRAPNVVALLPGADLTQAEEYVVVIAHLDGLGVGEPDEDGDSIFNGANDNASGVAALVEVAEAFGSLHEPPARPILFLAVSGSEAGAMGSRWFAQHPTVRLDSAVAVINVDAIAGGGAERVAVRGPGADQLRPLIARVVAASQLGLDVVPAGDDGPNPLDDDPFARLGLPAATITTGRGEHYHRPGDEAGAVDADKATRVARLLFLTLHRLAEGEATLP